MEAAEFINHLLCLGFRNFCKVVDFGALCSHSFGMAHR